MTGITDNVKGGAGGERFERFWISPIVLRWDMGWDEMSELVARGSRLFS